METNSLNYLRPCLERCLVNRSSRCASGHIRENSQKSQKAASAYCITGCTC